MIRGSKVIIIVYNYLIVMIMYDCWSFSCLVRWMVWLMVYYCFIVMIVSVKIDNFDENIVKNFVVWYFFLFCYVMVKLKYLLRLWIFMVVNSNRYIFIKKFVNVKLYMRNFVIVIFLWFDSKIISMMMLFIRVVYIIS